MQIDFKGLTIDQTAELLSYFTDSNKRKKGELSAITPMQQQIDSLTIANNALMDELQAIKHEHQRIERDERDERSRDAKPRQNRQKKSWWPKILAR